MARILVLFAIITLLESLPTTLVKAFFLDPLDSTLDFRTRTLAPLLRLLPDVVAFLQCDAYSPQQMNRLDVCPEIARVGKGKRQ